MDQDGAFQKIWQAFRAQREVDDGLPEHALAEKQSLPFASAVVRVPAGALNAEFETLRQELGALPFVRLVDPELTVITIQELGFLTDHPRDQSDITEGRLEEFAVSAASPISERKPFTVTLGGANSFRDAAFLEVRDNGGCAPLHNRLFELAAIPKAPEFPFVPSVTIGYYTEAAPGYRVSDVLNRWRGVNFAEFLVTELELILIHRENGSVRHETYAIIPLGS